MTAVVGVGIIPGLKLNLILALVLSAFASYVSAKSSNLSGIDADLKFIKKAVSLTPLQSFTSYPVVLQDVEAERTVYRYYTGDEKGKGVVFRRHGSDRHKSVVILDENEDHLAYTKEGEDNRIYVVLIQNPGNEKFYHVVFAYARNVPPNDVHDNSVIVINREKRRIEWDVWDQRGANKNKGSNFGWVTCLESFFVPCKPNFPDSNTQDYSDEEETGGLSGAKKAKAVSQSLERTAFKTEVGLDAGMNFDFFADLDDNNEQALMVGAVIDTVTDTVQFFAETAKKFVSAETNSSEVTIKAVQTLMSDDFIKVLLLDLKNIGNHSLQAIDGIERDMNQLIAEGYRVLRGIFNNSDSDHVSEKLMIGVFADEHEKPAGKKSERIGGRAANSVKTTITTTTNQAASASSKGSAKFKWKGFGPAPDVNEVMKSMAALQKQDYDNLKLPDFERKRRYSYGGQVPAHMQAAAAPQVQPQYAYNPAAMYQQQQPAMLPGKIGGDINGVDWRVYCARPNLSAGEKGWCGCHQGKEVSWGLSENIGDSVSSALSGKKISNDPSMFDPLFNTGVATVFCGAASAIIDVADLIAKPLGISPLLGQASAITGQVAGLSGGGPIIVGHLIHQGIKTIGTTTGTGGIIGMKGNGQGGGGGMFNFGGRSIGAAPPKKKLPEVLPDIETDVELFGHIGWRTQDMQNLNDLASSAHGALRFANQAFVGLGTCPYKAVSGHDFEKASSLLDVAKLYHTVLRTHCLDRHAVLLNDLVQEGHLSLNDDKTLSITDNCPSIKQTVLSERQIDRLSLAFSFSVFTQVYSEEMGNITENPKNALNMTISRPVHVMVQFAVNFLRETRRVAPIHFIKLARDLAQTIKTTFVKALQDFYRFKDCANCSEEDKNEASNDVFTLLGIFQFIVEGLGPIEHNGISPQTTLDNFFKLNQPALAEKLHLYTKHD